MDYGVMLPAVGPHATPEALVAVATRVRLLVTDVDYRNLRLDQALGQIEKLAEELRLYA